MSNLVRQPPFLFTYWNPFNEHSDLGRSWFDYVKDTSLAKYTADSVGLYLEQNSSDQIEALDSLSRRICGTLEDGFSGLQSQLSGVQTQLSGIQGQLRQVSVQLHHLSDQIQGVNQRLDLVLDEAKTSNLLQENIAELLRIPDSEKLRHHHIKHGLAFLKNALKDEDLYKDALGELLAAEQLMHFDYFVLHRIGLIYLYAPALGNLEKAAEYFTKAGKYAAVESDPSAVRLINILNKNVSKRFTEQAELSPADLSALAAESYYEAATSFYALGRFSEAVKAVEKATTYQPDVGKYRFFLAKYLTRAGSPESAVTQLQKAIELAPEMAIAAVGDFDLNRSTHTLTLLNQLTAIIDAELRDGISYFQQWYKQQTLWARMFPESYDRDLWLGRTWSECETDNLTTVSLRDYVGQRQIKQLLENAIRALEPSEILGNVLFVGADGVGKATLAKSVAKQMGRNINIIEASSILNTADICHVFACLAADAHVSEPVLLIENIDCLDPSILKYIHDATMHYVCCFTLVATASSCDSLPKDFLSCFRLCEHFEPYTPEEDMARSRPISEPSASPEETRSSCIRIEDFGFQKQPKRLIAAERVNRCIRMNDLTVWIARASEGLKAHYAEKRELISTCRNNKTRLNTLDCISRFGYRFSLEYAYDLLKDYNHSRLHSLALERLSTHYIVDSGLADFKYAPKHSEPSSKPWHEMLYDLLIVTADSTYFERTGSVTWKTESDTMPAVSDDGIAFIGLRGDLIALDKETGTELWRFKEGGSVGRPVVGGYMVMFEANNQIYALDGKTGRLVWKHVGGGNGLMIDGNGTVFAFAKHTLLAIDGETGKERWRVENPLDPSLAVCTNDSVIVSEGNNKLLCINSRTGDKVWSQEVLSEYDHKDVEPEITRRSKDTGELYPAVSSIYIHKITFTNVTSVTYDVESDIVYVVLSGRTREAMLYRPLDDEEEVPPHLKDRDVTTYYYEIVRLRAEDGKKVSICRYERTRNESTSVANIAIDAEGYLHIGRQNILAKETPEGVKVREVVHFKVPRETDNEGKPVLIAPVCGIAIGHDKVYVITHDTGAEVIRLSSIDPKSGAWYEHGEVCNCKEMKYCPMVIDNAGIIYFHCGSEVFAIYSNSERAPEAVWPMNRQNAQGTRCSTKPQFRVPTPEEIEAEEAQAKQIAKQIAEEQLREQQNLKQQQELKLKELQEKRAKATREAVARQIAELMADAVAAEEAENAKWFRKKDFSVARSLYAQAAACGSKEAAERLKHLPS